MLSRLYTLLLVCLVVWAFLAVFGMGGPFISAFVVALAWFTACPWSPFRRVLFPLGVVALVAALYPSVVDPSEPFRRDACACNIKQIGLALRNYHDAFGCFPPAYVADKTGKPMHSWRTLILPYMEERTLYKEYDFSEPWDGPNNKKLLEKHRLRIYTCPSDRSDPHDAEDYGMRTNYVAIVGKDAAWEGEKPRSLQDAGLRGKEDSTIMVVEAAGAGIRWTEPKDLSLEELRDGHSRIVVSSKHERGPDSLFRAGVPMANAIRVDGACKPLPTAACKDGSLLQIGGCADGVLHDAWDWPIHWPHCLGLPTLVISIGLLFVKAVRHRIAWRRFEKPINIDDVVGK